MHLGAFATRMLLGFYEYYAKITFFVLLFFCPKTKITNKNNKIYEEELCITSCSRG